MFKTAKDIGIATSFSFETLIQEVHKRLRFKYTLREILQGLMSCWRKSKAKQLKRDK